jgi:hypothetical protein
LAEIARPDLKSSEVGQGVCDGEKKDGKAADHGFYAYCKDGKFIPILHFFRG